jgi:hypothetical protein
MKCEDETEIKRIFKKHWCQVHYDSPAIWAAAHQAYNTIEEGQAVGCGVFVMNWCDLARMKKTENEKKRKRGLCVMDYVTLSLLPIWDQATRSCMKRYNPDKEYVVSMRCEQPMYIETHIIHKDVRQRYLQQQQQNGAFPQLKSGLVFPASDVDKSSPFLEPIHIHCAFPSCAGTTEKNSKLNKSSKLRACGRCKTVRYCSQDCQQKDWKRHQSACRLYPCVKSDKEKEVNAKKK